MFGLKTTLSNSDIKVTNGGAVAFGNFQRKLNNAPLTAALVIVAILSIIPVTVWAVGTTDAMATYQYLMSGAFDIRDGGDVAFNQFLAEKVAWIFKRLLPLVSNIAIACMVIVMAATIAYLSMPEFWDEVHFLSRERKARKYAGKGGGRGMRAYLNMGGLNQFVQSYGVVAMIKSYLPDLKSIAFYSAFEAGADGRPSMATYFKSSFPKHVAIMGMLMLINDRTLLELYFRGGEIVAYFFGKAAYNFDYPQMIENWLRSGKDFDPHFDGKDRVSKNKNKTFNSIYTVIKQVDKTPEGNTTEQKAIKGTAVRDWMLNTPEFQNVPWDKKNFAVKASFEPTQPLGYGEGEGEGVMLLSKPISDFAVSPEVANGYVVVYLTVEDNMVDLSGTAATDDATAWTGDASGGLTYDLDKSSLFKPYMDRLGTNAKPVITSARAQFNNEGGGNPNNPNIKGFTADFTEFCKVEGHQIRIDTAAAVGKLGYDPSTLYKVVIGVKPSSSSNSKAYMRTWVNPNAVYRPTTKSKTNLSGGAIGGDKEAPGNGENLHPNNKPAGGDEGLTVG